MDFDLVDVVDGECQPVFLTSGRARDRRSGEESPSGLPGRSDNGRNLSQESASTEVPSGCVDRTPSSHEKTPPVHTPGPSVDTLSGTADEKRESGTVGG